MHQESKGLISRKLGVNDEERLFKNIVLNRIDKKQRTMDKSVWQYSYAKLSLRIEFTTLLYFMSRPPKHFLRR